MAMRLAAALLCLGAVRAGEVSPVQKVIVMLEDLQTQAVTEGKAEAKTYDKFACFCKDMSEEKTWDIEDAQDMISELTASINEGTSDRADFDETIATATETIETREKSLENAKAARRKSHEEYQVNINDCYTAEKEIDMAVVELKAKEQEVAGAASLISLKGMVKTVRKMVLMADALGLETKHRKGMDALLQQEPGVPMEDFHFDATEVIKEVKELKPGFENQAKQLRLMESKNQFEHTSLVETLLHEKEVAEQTLNKAESLKAEAMKRIAADQQALTATTAQMTDDQAYLASLTETCNARSKDWDQRSKLRQDELTALTTALTIMKERVATKTTEKTVRLMQGAAKVAAATVAAAAPEASDDDEAQELAEAVEAGEPSFLQVLATPRRALSLSTKAGRQLRAAPAAVGGDALRTKVLTLLRKRGEELDSQVLSALATRVAADPFVKIKKLIQELIERLLQEAADEANHKGWCDKEFADAYQMRDMKVEQVTSLNTALSENEAKRDKLAEEIAKLTKELDELTDSLASVTKTRSDESAENAATTAEAEEGKAAVEEAIDILSKFYKTSAKAEVLVQESKQQPAIPDAGFEGAYKASQGASTGILGMMDVIKSDFERTIAETAKDEKAAAAEFLAFETETKSSISQKTVALNHQKSEIAETTTTIAEDQESLESEQKLLESALQQIMELQPACVDTGMSYEERVAKREQEIESLKEALCTLDKEGPEQTEPECQ